MTHRRTAVPPSARAVLFTCLLLSAVWAPALEATPGRPAAAVMSRDAERCRTRADLDACDDAVRRNPQDPGLLVSLGDALKRANRPVDSLRAYHRAAALAPNYRGLAAKIAVAETKKPAARVVARAAAAGPATQATAKHFTNSDPVAQSH